MIKCLSQKTYKMNDRIDIGIINVLRAFLNKDNILFVLVNEDWPSLYHLAEINSVSGIIGYVLEQSEVTNCPDEIRQLFSDAYLSTIAITTIRDEAMKTLIDLLMDNGIDHLLFKGYVVKDLYTVPELRTYGDIDFVVRREDRAKCDVLMRKNGYQIGDDWEPVYSYSMGTEHYEVHTELLDSNINERLDYRAYFKDFWDHTKKTAEHTYVFEPEYHLIYLLMHIAKHLYGSGAGIRMYLDIAFFLREYRDSIDWVHFQKEIEKLQLSRFVNTVFSAVEEWFEIKSPILLTTIDPGFMDRFLTFTLNGGVFGFEGRSSTAMQLRKNTSGVSVNRATTLLNRAFPPVKHMKARYTYLQTKPWLLPAAWLHRLFKKKGTTKEYIKESKDLLTMNKYEVVELNEFYKKIGI